MSAMNFAEARARVSGLIAAKKHRQLSESTVNVDKLSENVISDALAGSDRVRHAINDAPKVQWTDENGDAKTYEWSTFGDAMRDIMRSGFNYGEPALRAPDEIKPSHLFNREILAGALASDDFKSSRPYTQGNESESLYLAMGMADTLKKNASEVAEHIARSEQMKEAEEQESIAQEVLDKLRDAARRQHEQGEPIDDATREAIKDEIKRRGQARGQLKQLVEEHQGSTAVTQARTIARKAVKNGQESVDAMSSLPGMEPGQLTSLSPDQAIEIAEKWANNRDLRKIAEICGRLKRDMRFKRNARTKNVEVEPVGVTTGRELERLMPLELAKTQVPELIPLFVKGFAERSLLVYDMEGKAPAGKGPGIFVGDESYSMKDDDRIHAMKALALANLSIFHGEKRDFAYVGYGETEENVTFHFPKDKPVDPATVLALAEHNFAGGTDIAAAMGVAQKVITSAPKFTTADIILSTDGQDQFGAKSKAIRDELVKMGVRIHGIAIAASPNAYLSQMCDLVNDVVDLSEPGEVTRAIAEGIT